jgi:hypothetical protein
MQSDVDAMRNARKRLPFLRRVFTDEVESVTHGQPWLMPVNRLADAVAAYGNDKLVQFRN